MTTGIDETSRFVRELAANSRSLLSDAQLLLENRRWPRALALATLAKEEAAKALMVLLAQLEHREVTDLRQHRHEDKLTAAAATHLAFLGELDHLDEQVALVDGLGEHRAKLAALYVDLREGEVSTPFSVTAVEAQSSIETATGLIDWICGLVEQISPEVLQAAITFAHASYPSLEAYFREMGDKSGFELLRQALAQTTTRERC